MTKQKNALIQLEELQKRVGLMIKQYNDLARSESIDSRLVYGITDPYEKDDDGKSREIDSFYGKDDSAWVNSQNCWQDSGCSYG